MESASGSPAEPLATISFDDTFERFAPFVWRVVLRLGVPQDDVPDVSQEVFLVIHRRLADFRGASSLKTWIYGICLRVASAHRRRAYRQREKVVPELPDIAASADQDRELDHSRARQFLLQVLETLDEEKRQVFVLYEFEDLGMPEVAEIVGCPLTTAYSRLHAARKIVRSAFGRRALAQKGVS